ncbi:MAG: FAD-binding oxidoreductase [Thermoflexibacter sp.]|jgi:glycine/D-amino acid oxidase-like deaminating enzyme|nr:FAD-binding oxidoreductase [Thermoflexibacter sp.]
MKPHHYLIIGQGIAGTCLSYALLRRSQRVFVIDDAYQHSASMVAVGMFNPVTGKRVVKTWKAETLFPYLHEFYSDLGRFLKERILFPKIIYRPFESIEQQNSVLGQAAESAFQEFVHLDNRDAHYQSFVHNEFGGIELKQGGYIHVSKMLLSFRDFLQSTGNYLEAHFDENRLSFDADNRVHYHDEATGQTLVAERLIFCRGIRDRESKYWAGLPFRTVKGEVLTGNFKEQGVHFEEIINRSGWVLPYEDGTYKAGSTYDWSDTSMETTEKGKNEILEKVSNLLKFSFEVSKHEVGIRPATIDRRPLIGMHSIFPQIGIFNGLGTKGVMLAPYFAEAFCDYLLAGKELDKEVNINRFENF